MRHIYQKVAQDGQGNIIPNMTVSVFLAGTTTGANIYTASSGGSPVNSVLTATDGSYYFYVDDNDYSLNQKFKITITRTGYITHSYDNISIFAPVPSNIFYPDRNAADHGDIINAWSVKSIINLVGSDNATIILRNNSGSITTSYTVATALTIPSNIELKFEKGSMFVKSGAGAIIINSSPAGNLMHQIFSGFAAGEVLFSGGNTPDSIGSIWMGTGSSAINTALGSDDRGDVIQLHSGVHSLSAGLTFSNPNTTLRGKGASLLTSTTIGTRLRKDINGITGITMASERHVLNDLTLDCNLKTGDGILLQNSQGEINTVNVFNAGGTGYAIKLDQASANYFYGVTIKDCYKGIYIGGTTGSQQCIFTGIKISDDNPAGLSDKITIENTTGVSFYSCIIDSTVDGRAFSIAGNNTNISLFDLYCENTTASNVPSIEFTGTGNKSIGFFKSYINHGANNTQYMISVGNGVRGLNIYGGNFLRSAGSSNGMIYVGGTSEVSIRDVESSETGSGTYYFLRTLNHADTKNITVDGHIAVGARTAIIELYGSNHTVKNCKNTNIELSASNCSNILIENVDGTIDIVAGATNITIINCSGNINANNNTGLVLINCTGTLVGMDFATIIRSQTKTGIYANATRPAASSLKLGTQIWNSDDNAPNFSDGTNWRDATGVIT